MSILIAIANLIGVIIGLLIFSVLLIFLADWENDRNQKIALEEMSLALGILANTFNGHF